MKNLKKIISLALVVVTIFGSIAIVANAASYTTGTYTVSAPSGVNVRKGAGTGYSRVGAASKGVTFNVSKINGEWGYTSSIKCTNGTKSGWVSLAYCNKKSSLANSAKYSTGTYMVNASNGSNVRKGAGTNYSKVGAASKGVTFNVSKVSGEWGYTSSIKCTNGTKSGWISLAYCMKKSTSSSSTSSSKPTTSTTATSLSSKCNVQSTYYIGNTKFFKATLKSAHNGISKGTVVYLKSNYTPVTDKETLKKLMFTDYVNILSNNLIDIVKNYYSVAKLNDVCQEILSVQNKQKILGSISGSFASIMLTKNPKSLISSCTYLTEEGYIDLLTAILLEEVSAMAVSNADAVKSYCSNGVSSYEEAVKVKNCLVNARTAFLFSGTDCMLGLVDDYTNMSKATKSSLKTHFSAMFNTLVGTYGKALGDIVDIYSNGSTALAQLKNVYNYGKYSIQAKNTFDNLFDSKVSSNINAVYNNQVKLSK